MDRGIPTEEIRELFSPYVPDHNTELIVSPFEEVELGSKYDFALTSPPYFNIEQYPGEGQSHSKYNNYEQWRDGFYRTLIAKVFDSLNGNGYFCLQVGSQRYPLTHDGIRLAEGVGFQVMDVEDANMRNNLRRTQHMKGEVVLILRKRSVIMAM
jgi:DNA modification methylase